MNGLKKVAVLMGGIGAEREVSLQSGACVVTALRQAPLEVVGVDFHPDHLEILDDPSIDVFFPALHGPFGEDGQLQTLLDQCGAAYVGSGVLACQRTFDKLIAKRAFAKAGLRTPLAYGYSASADHRSLAEMLSDSSSGWVVKPVCQGSSVGVTILDSGAEVLAVAETTYSQFGDCMIEQFIAGREVTVGVLLDECLPVIEVKPQQGFYDYQAKYLAEDTGYLFDTLPKGVVQALQADTRRCFAAVGMRHFGRIDFLVDAEERAWVLEANAIPGLTSHSLLPKAAQKVGLSMTDMCLRLIEAAALGLPAIP